MKTKKKISITALALVVLFASYWTGYVHGSSILSRQEAIISVVFPAILIWTLAKLTFAFFFRFDGGGSQPPSSPPSGVPAPRPSGVPPEIYCEHAA